MINKECQECWFSNSCSSYDQRSIKYNCEYLLDFEINDYGGNGNNKWTGVSYNRYVENYFYKVEEE